MTTFYNASDNIGQTATLFFDESGETTVLKRRKLSDTSTRVSGDGGDVSRTSSRTSTNSLSTSPATPKLMPLSPKIQHPLASSPKVKVLGSFANPPKSSTTSADEDSNEVRIKYRQKLLDILEENDEEEKHLQTIKDIMQSEPFDKHSVEKLRLIPIRSSLLNATAIGKLVMSNKEVDGAGLLLETWKTMMKGHIETCHAIEHELFKRYADKNGHIHKANQNHWRYTQDMREILQLLRKNYNKPIKQELLKGSMTGAEFVGQLSKSPEIFDSPAKKAAKEQAKLEDEIAAEKITLDDFPFEDSNLICPSCQSDQGGRYNVTYFDGWEGYRAREDSRTVICQCNACFYQWQRTD